MDVHVLSGPTLPPARARELFPEANCHGPAEQGSILSIVRSQRAADAIILIDGYFEHRHAVSHKEILWALSRGTHVFGASSLGALRAVELEPFGMVGWGRVFTQFATGELEDDDEVAVAHASAEDGYRTASHAMVNIRATLQRARAEGVIADTMTAELLATAKARFYAERHLRALLNGDERAEAMALRRWLDAGNFVDQKRMDAEGLLLHVRARFSATPEPRFVPAWEFPYTSAWENILAESARLSAPRGESHPYREGPEDHELPLLVEELQLLGPATFADFLLPASLRALALEISGATSKLSTDLEIGMEPTTLATALRQFPAILERGGNLQPALQRARQKARWVRDDALPALSADQQLELLRWYFETRLQTPVPTQLSEHINRIGIGSLPRFLQMLLRERAYLQQRPAS